MKRKPYYSWRHGRYIQPGKKPYKPPVEPFEPDPSIVQALQPQSRPKPLEGQMGLFTNRTEPAKRRRGESNDQQTLF